ncbi:hypothetical protein [Natronoglycomyces albus]|uniref:LicD family protein n=1 Tax=Natronoglycomyces albus TaxID=2811108 RepID=A0A895XP08_9ACTN|nr:hypothetical protein [Natronoglycomyces albus]QSB04805.1 hypothetical protein JQS30_13685 [Natronoglycomyces albus]
MKLKQVVARAVTKLPAYKVLPPGGLRTYAALKYQSERLTAQEMADYIDSIGGVPLRYYSVAMSATRSMFLAGADEAAREALLQLIDRFPEHVEPRCLYSEFLGYHGDYQKSLELARQARMLQPSSARALAREVQAAYQALDIAQADEVAVAAVGRMPRNNTVVGAAARMSHTPEQYKRIYAAWEHATTEPGDLLRTIRPLATAAARAGLTEQAIETYRSGIRLVLDGHIPPKLSPPVKLGGRGAWSAIIDLHETLSKAGVPHFFAAGTALGLVREGRPLSADGDIDLGVFEADYDRDKLSEIFRAHPRFEIVTHPLTEKVGLRHRGGSPIDIFRFYEEDGSYFHDGVFVRWRNSAFDIDTIRAQGTDLPIPSDHETYLTENYGDWRTPYPGFDAFIGADAPNVETTDPVYLRLHFLRRAYRCLVEGDMVGARDELTMAEEDELARSVGGLWQLSRNGWRLCARRAARENRRMLSPLPSTVCVQVNGARAACGGSCGL